MDLKLQRDRLEGRAVHGLAVTCELQTEASVFKRWSLADATLTE